MIHQCRSWWLQTALTAHSNHLLFGETISIQSSSRTLARGPSVIVSPQFSHLLCPPSIPSSKLSSQSCLVHLLDDDGWLNYKNYIQGKKNIANKRARTEPFYHTIPLLISFTFPYSHKFCMTTFGYRRNKERAKWGNATLAVGLLHASNSAEAFPVGTSVSE